MFKPKIKHEDKKYCKLCLVTLEPHVKTVQGFPGEKIYHMDFWYCPQCGLMYHFEDLKIIVEKEV